MLSLEQHNLKGTVHPQKFKYIYLPFTVVLFLHLHCFNGLLSFVGIGFSNYQHDQSRFNIKRQMQSANK